jgi:hypothetical protein
MDYRDPNVRSLIVGPWRYWVWLAWFRKAAPIRLLDPAQLREIDYSMG